MKKLLFIYNPFAGKAQITDKLSAIIDVFTKADYLVTCHPTQSRGDATQTVIDLSADYDLIVCSGGDGTLDETVTGMLQCDKKIPIGYIPAGSTNDFARSLRISNNMIEAAQQIVEGREYQCDAGFFNDDFFIYVAAFGLFTDVTYNTNQQIKNVLGHAAYVLEGAKALGAVNSFELTVECDDEVYKGEYIFGMVTNSRSVGGFSKLTGKNVDLNDGYLEVLLIKKPQNILELNEIITALLSDHFESEYVECTKAKRINFTSPDEIPWTLDGEYGGRHRKVVVRDEYQAVDMIIPSKEAVAAAGYVEPEEKLDPYNSYMEPEV